MLLPPPRYFNNSVKFTLPVFYYSYPVKDCITKYVTSKMHREDSEILMQRNNGYLITVWQSLTVLTIIELGHGRI